MNTQQPSSRCHHYCHHKKEDNEKIKIDNERDLDEVKVSKFE